MSTNPTPTRIAPRGPAANPAFPPSNASGNPYKYSDALLLASQLPPRVTATHVFFCGYEGEHPLVCLSQWFAAEFAASTTGAWLQGGGGAHVIGDGAHGATLDVDFPTAEHFMMYHKARLMGDEATAARILAPEHAHPSHAKRLGREVRDFDQDRWTRWAERIVEAGNLAKFSDRRNADLKTALLFGTMGRVIVEASPDDRIWGVGFDAQAAEAREAEWGENRLGRVLGRVRDRLGGAGV